MQFSKWGVAMAAILVAGGVACLALGESTLAGLLFGAVVGQQLPPAVTRAPHRGAPSLRASQSSLTDADITPVHRPPRDPEVD